MKSPKLREKQSRNSDVHLSRTLRKLAAVLLRIGINAPRAEDLLRTAFVHAAEAAARSHGPRVSQSQIATISGVNRLDVRKVLSKNNEKLQTVNAKQSRVDLVLAAWRREAQFRDSEGRPRPLTFKGKSSDFSKLVRKYGRDVTTRSILEHLLRIRAVTVKNERLMIASAKKRESVGVLAARSDLRFLDAQLHELHLAIGRRSHATQKAVVNVANLRLARRIQRTTLEKIRLLLNALDAMSYSKKQGQKSGQHRLIVTSNVTIESGRQDDETAK